MTTLQSASPADIPSRQLHDPEFFARMELDSICGTVAWPNGADFAPEALHDLAAVEPPVTGRES
jgi:hypothetical protein